MLTLKINNKQVSQNLEKHQAQKTDRIFLGGVFTVTGNLIWSCLSAFVFQNGPVVAVLSNSILLFLTLVYIVCRFKFQTTWYIEYIILLFLLVHSTLCTLVNTGQLPSLLLGAGIDQFRPNYQTMFFIFFIFQLVSIEKVVLIMTPTYLVAEYYYYFWLKQKQ